MKKIILAVAALALLAAPAAISGGYEHPDPCDEHEYVYEHGKELAHDTEHVFECVNGEDPPEPTPPPIVPVPELPPTPPGVSGVGYCTQTVEKGWVFIQLYDGAFADPGDTTPTAEVDEWWKLWISKARVEFTPGKWYTFTGPESWELGDGVIKAPIVEGVGATCKLNAILEANPREDA